MSNATYKCTRCAGTGRLNCFSNVLGGVCFKCKGSGMQTTKPAKPSIKWAVLGEDRNTGMRARLYNVSSPSAAGAIAKARRTFEGASTEFRDQYSMAAAIAVPAEELDRNPA